MPASRVSILIPAYRASRYIAECLDSVYSQEPGGAEVVVGVDGCRATLDAIHAGRRDRWPGLRVLWRGENRGGGITRNTLVKMTERDYIIFFDADDIMLPGLVAWCLTMADAKEAARFRYIERDEGQGGAITITNPTPFGASGTFGIRRDSFERLGGFLSWPCAVDVEFQNRADFQLGKHALSPGALFVYRRHGESVTRILEAKAGPKALAAANKARLRAVTREQLASRVDAETAGMEEVAPCS